VRVDKAIFFGFPLRLLGPGRRRLCSPEGTCRHLSRAPPPLLARRHLPPLVPGAAASERRASARMKDEEDGAARCGEESVGVMARGVGTILCHGQASRIRGFRCRFRGVDRALDERRTNPWPRSGASAVRFRSQALSLGARGIFESGCGPSAFALAKVPCPGQLLPHLANVPSRLSRFSVLAVGPGLGRGEHSSAGI
jgi:hypothetical protein